jgi:hypothetical protein
MGDPDTLSWPVHSIKIFVTFSVSEPYATPTSIENLVYDSS